MIDAPPIVLTVAGSDPSGGAGLQADLKTIHQHGGYGAAVPTLLTVQSTGGVAGVELLSGDSVAAQLRCVLEDMTPAAAKTGALGSPAVAAVLGSIMEETRFPWVVDPVWLPSRGQPIARGSIVEAYKTTVIPRAELVTPNVEEASLLAEVAIRSLDDADEAAQRIVALGARAVLIKGGHLQGPDQATDLLRYDGGVARLAANRVVDGEFHGTGCALSAAIAARLAHGDELVSAVRGAKAWLTDALAHAFPVGKGAVPVNHLWRVDRKP